jgi:hypothetical protein
MSKRAPNAAEEARQQAMTGYLSLVALTLAGLLFLVLAERYL